MNIHIRSIIAGMAVASAVLPLSACTPESKNSTPTVSAESSSTAMPLQTSDALESELNVENNVRSAATGTVAQLIAESTRPEVVVYKSASCGCCKDWVAYLEDEGFKVKTFNHDNVDQIKAEHGLTEPGLKSCHTALVDGYVIEGHVPVSDIDRLLAERPDVVGLTAPGMPPMSPGMGSLTPMNYDVLAFRKDGSSLIYSSY